jgi:NAD(P)-dependent dehydrogenase (short-subunit alcohol dehydrogenase family)
MAGEFQGKVVVVTGGSKGIGRAIATAFAREGASCVLAASSAANLVEAAKTVARAGGPEPMTVAGDLRTLAGCQQVFAQVNERHKRCDVLINCAGATRAGDFLTIPDEAWADGFALKFFGAVRLSRLFWPLLTAAHGHVVNIIGGAGRTVEPEFLIGGSVNSALANFTKGLSRRGMRDGVNVNAIHPGATATERTHTLLRQRSEATGRSVEELRAEQVARTGVQRMAEPEDIAALTLFLCSERARHIQGTATAVDGGATPGLY